MVSYEIQILPKNEKKLFINDPMIIGYGINLVDKSLNFIIWSKNSDVWLDIHMSNVLEITLDNQESNISILFKQYLFIVLIVKWLIILIIF